MKPVKFMLLAIAVLGGWLAIFNSTFAQTWVQTSAPTNDLYPVVSSVDGLKLAAIGDDAIYTSTNSGNSWISNNIPNLNWTDIASSADGNKLIIVSYNGFIYLSTNSGQAWKSPMGINPNKSWFSVASSADGTKLMASYQNGLGGGIYTSTNSGNSWVSNSVPNLFLRSVASSADGDKLIAVGDSVIYTSTNSGNTWVSTSVPFGVNHLLCVASSADGSKLLATGQGAVCVSTNSGNIWVTSNVPRLDWGSAAMSADGSKLIIGASGDLSDQGYTNGGPIFTSTDLGKTWTSNNVPDETWTSIASSADGSKLAASTEFNEGFWIAQSTPTPQLNIAPTNLDLKFSWLVPSTNFVLQQSSDLSNWSDVTNSPALNLINLQEEVVLSPTNGSGFYRLESR
ncbi:MAG TPA: hypothetical protein VHG89_09520 [Verrucomicrobiae bacterium]|nr:hypothetical protein [Verrucomicrobiae bacterium]